MSTIRAMMPLVLAALLIGGPVGCSKSQPPQRKAGLRVLCSTYPMYLFTRQVTAGCEGVTVELMLPASVGCPHDYSLTPGDMRKLAAADVVILNGLGLDDMFTSAIRQANPNAKVVLASAGIGGLLPLSPSAHTHDEHDADDDDDDDGHDHHGHHHDPGLYNPHLFASPRMAACVVLNLAVELAAQDSVNAARYMQNAHAYHDRLVALGHEMGRAFLNVPNRKIVTEHAVFDYLARDCGLKIAAVIEEIPGLDPAAAEIRALITQIRSSGAAAIFTEPKPPLDGPQRPTKIGQTLADELRLPVEVLDPVALGPDDPPADYYETRMRANLATLVRILNANSQ